MEMTVIRDIFFPRVFSVETYRDEGGSPVLSEERAAEADSQLTGTKVWMHLTWLNQRGFVINQIIGCLGKATSQDMQLVIYLHFSNLSDTDSELISENLNMLNNT